MGLDMYAYRTKVKPETQTDFEAGENDTQIQYWRKHPNLHGWMEQLYYDKGGKADTFNCVNMELDMQDLKVLKEVIEYDELPQTGGFFFGNTDGTEKADDLAFVETSMKAIEEGDTVYYTSWW
jgi:hypothetical protein